MKILAFAASNNTVSINRTLAAYAANLVDGAEVEVLNIHDYEMPIFSDEREQELGQPEQAKAFYQKISNVDAIVVSYAEHNGSYTAAYKNLFDWASRINKEVFQQKPAVFLATSPGPGGASNVLAAAANSASYFGAQLKAAVSVPSFFDNFDTKTNEMTNPKIAQEIRLAMQLLYSDSSK